MTFNQFVTHVHKLTVQAATSIQQPLKYTPDITTPNPINVYKQKNTKHNVYKQKTQNDNNRKDKQTR